MFDLRYTIPVFLGKFHEHLFLLLDLLGHNLELLGHLIYTCLESFELLLLQTLILKVRLDFSY